MRNDDKLIREALKLNIGASDELNERVLEAVDKQRGSFGAMKTAVAFIICLVVLLGTGVIVDASTGGRVIGYLRGKLDNRSYVVSGESNASLEIIRENGSEYEKVTFVEDKVSFSHERMEDETEYCLYLKLSGAESDGIDDFISLSAYVMEGMTEEDLYYVIRDRFLDSMQEFYSYPEDKKEQLVAGIREAAANTDSAPIRDALLNVVDDFENNHKMLFYFQAWDWFICEDLTDLPLGEATVIVDTVDHKGGSWIVTLTIEKTRTYIRWSKMIPYTEEAHQQLMDEGVEIYDRRR
ncbi:MAG: hypothetical protein ACI4E2_06430 [Acetatifactor sp.]